MQISAQASPAVTLSLILSSFVLGYFPIVPARSSTKFLFLSSFPPLLPSCCDSILRLNSPDMFLRVFDFLGWIFFLFSFSFKFQSVKFKNWWSYRQTLDLIADLIIFSFFVLMHVIILCITELKRDLYLCSVYLVFENFITVSFDHYLSIYILRQSCDSRTVIVPCFYPSSFGQFCGWGLITKALVHSTKCLSASLLFSVLAYCFEK